MSALSTAQVRMLARLREGNLNNLGVDGSETRTLNVLEKKHLVGIRTYEHGREWYITPDGEAAIPTSGDEQAHTVNLDVAEIPEAVLTADVPHTFKKYSQVECLKVFPKPEEKGVWLTGIYMGVYPGDARYACVRIDGVGEMARVGDVRPVGGVQRAAPLAVVTPAPVYDQPALPTDDDVHEVMNREYPTVETNGGLGQHRNKGMLAATFATLTLVELADVAHETAALGVQETPQDSMIFNRRQEDGTFRPLNEFFERDVEKEEALSGYAGEPAAYDNYHEDHTTQSTFAQLAADEPLVDPAEADTEPTPVAGFERPCLACYGTGTRKDPIDGYMKPCFDCGATGIHTPVDETDELLSGDPFNGMAEMELNLQLIPITQREAVRMEIIDITPAMFKPLNRTLDGVFMSSAKVFARKNQWQGRVWAVGRWTSRLALALAIDGTLLMLDGVMAYEVRTSQATLDTLFTAWAGLCWRVRGDREVAVAGAK